MERDTHLDGVRCGDLTSPRLIPHPVLDHRKKEAPVSNSPAADTRCPRCGGTTRIHRRGGPPSLGSLQPHEFEILVRNEWRRRLGTTAYGRAHDVRIVRVLVQIAETNGSGHESSRLADEVDLVAADLIAEGNERDAVRREVHQLLRACRIVLERAGADKASVATFMARALRAIRYVLTDPVTRSWGNP